MAMTIFKHELRRGKVSLLVWTAAVSFMLGVCILIYPDLSAQMEEVSGMFADMGSFSAAFGMDKINFGEFIGYFGVECGNVLGLGGAFFAALLGISALAKEEREHTAEFLLAHPVKRSRVIAEKLCAVLAQIVIFQGTVVVVTALAVLVIGEDVSVKTLALLFFAYFLMQLEVAAVTFGISAFLRRGGFGLGLGFAVVSYFLNIIANLMDETRFLKYITPFGFTESADIITDNAINSGYLAVGMCFAVAGVLLAFWKYQAKDIA